MMIRKLVSQTPSKAKSPSPEMARFQAEMAAMASSVFSGVRHTSLQGIDAALALVTQDQPGLHGKAQHLADQVLDRALHVNREIHRFFSDSRLD